MKSSFSHKAQITIDLVLLLFFMMLSLCLGKTDGWGWKGPLEVFLSNHPYSSTVTQSLLPRITVRRVLKSFVYGDCPAFLGNLFQCSVIFSVKCPCPPLFDHLCGERNHSDLLETLRIPGWAHCPLSTYHVHLQEESGFIFSVPCHRVAELSPSLPFLKLNRSCSHIFALDVVPVVMFSGAINCLF